FSTAIGVALIGAAAVLVAAYVHHEDAVKARRVEEEKNRLEYVKQLEDMKNARLENLEKINNIERRQLEDDIDSRLTKKEKDARREINWTEKEQLKDRNREITKQIDKLEKNPPRGGGNRIANDACPERMRAQLQVELAKQISQCEAP